MCSQFTAEMDWGAHADGICSLLDAALVPLETCQACFLLHSHFAPTPSLFPA